MCIAVPGNLKSIAGESPFNRLGQVDFGGVEREVNLVYVPEAKVGDWVLVHTGFAIGLIDEDEAKKVFEDLEAMAGFEESETE